MSNVPIERIKKALREHSDAVDKYDHLLGPAREFVPGEEIVIEEWTKKHLKEFTEAKAKVDETWEKLIRLLEDFRS